MFLKCAHRKPSITAIEMSDPSSSSDKDKKGGPKKKVKDDVIQVNLLLKFICREISNFKLIFFTYI